MFIESVKEESKRTIITVIAPGLLAIFPWSIYFINSFMKHELLKDSFLAISSLVFLLSIVSGMICENFGSFIERTIDCIHSWRLKKFTTKEKCDVELFKDFNRVWNGYLLMKNTDRSIERYYSSLVIRYKFELSLLPALGFCYLGLLLLDSDNLISEHLPAFFLYVEVASIILFVLVVRWAYQSAGYLHELRFKMITECIND